MGVKGFERRLEHMVEGVFARLFRSGLTPIELGRRLVRELDMARTVDVRGRVAVPNDITVALDATDYERLTEILDTLVRELADAAREHARDEGYSFLGPVEVHLVVGPDLRPGTFSMKPSFKEGLGGVGFGSLLLPDGQRYPLGNHSVVIGRHPDCEVVLQDSNASRRRAEVRPVPGGFGVFDLQSTNGIQVNGVHMPSRELRDGDEISIGNARILFQAS